jgi:hypothetical protein
MPDAQVGAENLPPTPLLVTGVPCTGKTTFARWLATEQDFVSCHVDHDQRALQDAATAASSDRRVILDWGIPVGALDFARQFIQQFGFQAWWFDGDVDTAKQVFVGRPNHPASLTDWDIYMTGLRTHASEYAALYNDRLIRALEPGPRWTMTDEEIWTLIQAY